MIGIHPIIDAVIPVFLQLLDQELRSFHFTLCVRDRHFIAEGEGIFGAGQTALGQCNVRFSSFHIFQGHPRLFPERGTYTVRTTQKSKDKRQGNNHFERFEHHGQQIGETDLDFFIVHHSVLSCLMGDHFFPNSACRSRILFFSISGRIEYAPSSISSL